jgi:replicative DNA helicase
MTVEREGSLLSAISSPEDFYRARMLGVSDQWFSAEGYRLVWQFFGRYVENTGHIPGIEFAQSNFPEFRAFTHGTIDWEVEQLKGDYESRFLRSLLASQLQPANLVDTAPTEAMQNIIDGIQQLRVQLSAQMGYYGDPGDVVTVADRVSKFHENPDTAFIGLRTGFEPLDLTGIGWTPGDLNTIVARPSVGKSELMCRTAVEAVEQGKRVLFVSPEMTRQQINFRADPIFAWRRGIAGFPTNRQIMTGQMSAEQLKVYSQFRQYVASNDQWLTLDKQSGDVFRVDAILATARQHRADLLIIDGVGMIRDSQRAQQAWQVITNVLRDLKLFAEEQGIAVVTGQHAKPSVKLTDVPDMNDVYNGDAVSQLSDRLITMALSRRDRDTRVASVQKNRNDVNISKRKVISFNMDTGDVGRWVDTPEQKSVSDMVQFLRAKDITSQPLAEFTA